MRRSATGRYSIAPKVTCRDELLEKPGPVSIALTGRWDGKEIVLKATSNHAKVRVSTIDNADRFAREELVILRWRSDRPI